MKQSIRIRNTGIRITEVLDLLAEGNSLDQIVKRQPKLTMTDILAAIAFARDIVTNYVTADDEINIGGFITIHAKSSRVVDVTKVREEYPRAYEKWRPAEDTELTGLFHRRFGIEEMAKKLRRQPGAINARLLRLGLIKPRQQPDRSDSN